MERRESNSEVISVICVKWGDMYSRKHVNNLYDQIKKHLKVPFKFYCYTDNPKDLDENIQIIPIEDEYDGVWNKLSLFNMDLGKTLYLDLDVFIQNDIDQLLDKDSFTLIQCYWKPLRELESWDHNINSSVMLWYGLENKHIYDHFKEDPELYMLKYPGIDHFIFHEGYKPDHWEQGLIYSRMFGRDEDSWFNPAPEPYWINDGLICLFNGPKYLLSSSSKMFRLE